MRHFRKWDAEVKSCAWRRGDWDPRETDGRKVEAGGTFGKREALGRLRAPEGTVADGRPAPPPRLAGVLGPRRESAATGRAAECPRAVQRYFGIHVGARIAKRKWFLGRSVHPPV